MNSILREHRSKLLIKSFVLLLVSVLAATDSRAQTESEGDNEDSEYITIDRRRMGEVVRAILRAEFGRVKGPKRIEIYDPGDSDTELSDIEEAWLPQLQGVRFALVSEAELKRRDGSNELDVFFFKPKIFEGRYKLGFAHGEPHCSYFGSDWAFNIIGKVAVVPMNNGFGAGCSSGFGH